MLPEYTAAELDHMDDEDTSNFKMYNAILAGFKCKDSTPYGDHLFYNPETKEVIGYHYWESTGYGDSASDIVYNGHYSESFRYTAK